MQLFTVDTKNLIMKVYDGDKLVKEFENVWIGKNGVSDAFDMLEGNMKTPLGEYNLGVAFGIHDININYPYIKIDDNSYWVDDYKSVHYNYFVEVDKSVDSFGYPYIISGKKDFSSAEHLIDFKKQYEYAIFIEYNIHDAKDGIGNNKSSAIFLHCHGDKGYTGGCVALNREDMKWIMEFIDLDKKPKIKIF